MLAMFLLAGGRAQAVTAVATHSVDWSTQIKPCAAK